jgi:hypothetical protein
MGDTTQMLTAETKETSNSKVTPVFDQVTCHEDVLGSVGIAPCILNLSTRYSQVVSFTPDSKRGSENKATGLLQILTTETAITLIEEVTTSRIFTAQPLYIISLICPQFCLVVYLVIGRKLRASILMLLSPHPTLYIRHLTYPLKGKVVRAKSSFQLS